MAEVEDKARNRWQMNCFEFQKFIEEWKSICKMVKKSRKDLSKIPISCIDGRVKKNE